jgi:hypothetical protein
MTDDEWDRFCEEELDNNNGYPLGPYTEEGGERSITNEPDEPYFPEPTAEEMDEHEERERRRLQRQQEY